MDTDADPMPIALIPDEYTHDPATAFEIGRRWGVEHYEIRYAYRFRVPVGPAWAAERVAAAVKDYAVTVTGISPGLFKPTMHTDGSAVPISTDAPDEIRRHLDELLPAFLDFAGRLGTTNVTVFALPKAPGASGGPPAVVIDCLSEAAERAAAGGVRLLLENGGGSWADSAEATAAILKAVGSDALRLTWDPANVAHAFPGADPVGAGYRLVRDYVANVHVKDVKVTDAGPAWCTLGEGLVDWPAQLAALRADGYPGRLTLEPHFQYQPGMSTDLVGRVKQSLTDLRGMVGR